MGSVLVVASLLGWRRIREVDVEVIPPELAEPWPTDNGASPPLVAIEPERAAEDVEDVEEPEAAPPAADAAPADELAEEPSPEIPALVVVEPEEHKEVEELEAAAPTVEPEPADELAEEPPAEIPALAAVEAEEVVAAEPEEAVDEPEAIAVPAEPEEAADEPEAIAVPAEPEEAVDEPAAEEPHHREATCEIALWRGYRQATFYARMVVDGREVAVAKSETFRPTGKRELEESEPAVAAHRALCEELVRRGWTRTGRNDAWYADGFRAVVRLPEETDDDETGSF